MVADNAPIACGLIGLGLMGRGMGLSLMRAGMRLHIAANRNRLVVDELVAAGATEHADGSAVAEHSAVIVLCLPGISPTEKVLFGEGGVAQAKCESGLVIDCSTQTPSAARDFQIRLKAVGKEYVDAPVTGGPADALHGRLQALVSGEPEAIEQAMPVLQAMCQRVTRFGGPGSAQEAKLVNNFLAFGSLALMAEALSAAEAAGLDRAALMEAVRYGGGQSRAFERMGQHLAGDPAVTSKATLHTVEKDVRYYNDWAAQVGCAGPMGRIVLDRFATMVERGYGDVYTPDYVRQIAKDFGVQL